MAGEFEGKVVIVTGATSGLGETVAKMLLEQGAKVAALARGVSADTAAALLKGTGATAANLLPLKCDISDEAQVESCFSQTANAFGRIDILLANAAICYPEMKTVDTSLDDWNATIAINLTGTFLTCKHALKHMIPRKYGKIVLTDSSWAFVGEPGYASYIATKGGVWSMGRNLALENGVHNINVNMVCPGNIDTPQLRSAIDLGSGPPEESIRNRFGQVSSTREVAEVMLFLASDRASALQGAHIVVDHGASLKDGRGILVG